MNTPTDFEIALRLAGAFIERFDPEVAFTLDTDESRLVDLEISARDEAEFWQVASVLNRMPERVKEIIETYGDLTVTLYVWKSEAE